jgi:peptidoglycan/xylan/chitin deacetylase (PgdA/CDA1 family)
MFNRRAFLLGSAACVLGTVQSAKADEASSCSFADPDPRYPGFYSSDPAVRGEVVLTFDDGPHPAATPKVLNLLRDHGMVATFFVVGHAITEHTYALIQRMVNEGHSLGTHTYNHDIHMATRRGRGAVDYITGQYAVAHLCIEIALLARSPEHFGELYQSVFERKAGFHVSTSELEKKWRKFDENHRNLLNRMGYGPAQRPCPLLYARPPGGIPYLGNWSSDLRLSHEKALARLGLLNVLWHGGAGDTDPERARDYGFLVGNLRYASRRGGILLLHDGIKKDALGDALARMAADPEIRVVPLERSVERKFACDERTLRAALAPVAPGSEGLVAGR